MNLQNKKTRALVLLPSATLNFIMCITLIFTPMFSTLIIINNIYLCIAIIIINISDYRKDKKRIL